MRKLENKAMALGITTYGIEEKDGELHQKKFWHLTNTLKIYRKKT